MALKPKQAEPKPGEQSLVEADEKKVEAKTPEAEAAAKAAAEAEAKKKAEAGDGADDADAGDSGDDDDEGAADDAHAAPDNWREILARGDEKRLAFYKRFTDVAALDRHIELTEKRVREKGGITPPKADAPAAEKAKFYTENFGRPKDVEALKELDFAPTLEEGEELTADEDGVIKAAVGMAYDSGVFGAEQLRALAQIAADMSVGGRKEQGKQVEAYRQQTKKSLAKEWRGDTEANINLAISYTKMRCEQAGVDVAALANEKLANGALLGDNALFLKVMALGGREHAEDPLMLREDAGSSSRAGDLQSEMAKEMAKANGTAADKKYYDSEAGRARRAKLRTDLKRLGGGGKPKAK